MCYCLGKVGPSSDDLLPVFGVKMTGFQGFILLEKCFRFNNFGYLKLITKFENLFFTCKLIQKSLESHVYLQH